MSDGEVKGNESVAAYHAATLGEDYSSGGLEQVGDDNTMAENGAFMTYRNVDASMADAFAVIRADATSLSNASESLSHADATAALTFEG